MIYTFAKHAGWSLRVRANGECSPESIWGYIGEAARKALGDRLGDRKGIARFGEAHVPAERALSRAAVDIKVVHPGYFVGTFESGDTWPEELSARDIPKCMKRFSFRAGIFVHVDTRPDVEPRARTAHYTAKAAFKSLAVAFKRAAARVSEKERDIIISKG
ncbi:hypothetical protein GGR51DRAFT_563533 [Nemania sp. FL0031]|nr:hypothetical protein GGR51DRAFT_563533 [Nemania sp. FL0031]